MRHGLRGLRVLCAVDSYVFGQIRAKRPVSSQAHSGAQIIDALEALGADVQLFAVDERDAEIGAALHSIECDVVFNLALSGTCREFHFIALLELASLPFTGSGAAAIMLSRNKFFSRQLLKSVGINVPGQILLDGSRALPGSLRFPVILKPSVGAGSTGIGRSNIVFNPVSLTDKVKSARRRFDAAVVAEEFVVGREFRVSAVESKRNRFEVSAINESVFPGCYRGLGIMTSALKRSSRIRMRKGIKKRPARLGASMTDRICGLCLRSLAVLGIAGYAALDVRMNEAGELFVIDVNPNPSLKRSSTDWSKPSFEETIERIVVAGLRRSV